jgi:hypothetical protein
MTARPQSSILGPIFASDIVDLFCVSAALVARQVDCKLCERTHIQTVGGDNPKQQLTVRVRETVPQLFRDEYRRASLEGTTFVVQSECSSLENVGCFVAVKVYVLHYRDLTEQDENPSIRDHLTLVEKSYRRLAESTELLLCSRASTPNVTSAAEAPVSEANR